ncbi:isochorismate synthase [Haloparvum sedimenti]|uniref:isochorismate synthase n=1 Tax=Haloparvum sedimenti TaxID=1678448 RepID=UPI00071E7AB0|nr:isochorismate synthase [Haloparvum sedimenti]
MESPRSTDRPTLVSRATRIDPPAFRAAFDALDAPRTVWSAPGEATVVAGGAAATLTADSPDRFAAVRDAAEALFRSGDVHAGTEAARPRLFGGFSFHADRGERDGSVAESEAAAVPEPTGADDGGGAWSDFPDARFVFPRVQVTFADNGVWLTVNAAGPDADPDAVERRLDAERESLSGLADERPRPPRPGIEARRRTTTLTDWRAGVEAAIDRIESGRLRKVVLAQALETDLGADLSWGATLERLAEAYPDCRRFCIEPDAGGTAFIGATPERLVSLRGRTVETDALAGTTGRGETPEEDEWLAEELLADAKNSHEHEIVVDAIRDQLDPFAASIATGERRVKRLATVQHLHTPITAELNDDHHVLDLVESLHPTPAVGGLPPDAALETIRATEPFDRGWYAAPVGWIDAAGNGSFAVAIRSAVVARRRATLFAGVGIVADSDPDREWDEVQLKYRPILDELERD